MTSDDMLILEKISALIESLGYDYWIDSGTLLGLYRDKSLIDGDLDVDISVIVPEKERDDFRRSILSLRIGSTITKKYCNRIHKLKIDRGKKKRMIDISFFSLTGDGLHMPVLRLEKILESLRSYRFVFAMKLFMGKAYLYIQAKFSTEKKLDYGLPMLRNLLREKEIWVYPKSLIFPIGRVPGFDFCCPGQTEDFLEFRYRQWKTPVQIWKSENMDKGFVVSEKYFEIL